MGSSQFPSFPAEKERTYHLENRGSDPPRPTQQEIALGTRFAQEWTYIFKENRLKKQSTVLPWYGDYICPQKTFMGGREGGKKVNKRLFLLRPSSSSFEAK